MVRYQTKPVEKHFYFEEFYNFHLIDKYCLRTTGPDFEVNRTYFGTDIKDYFSSWYSAKKGFIHECVVLSWFGVHDH